MADIVRYNPRAFGAGTTIRFLLLTLVAVATTWDAWQLIAQALGGTSYREATTGCVDAVQATLGVRPPEWRQFADVGAADEATIAAATHACSSPVATVATYGQVAAVGILLGCSAVAYWVWPLWVVHRRHLIPFPEEEFPELAIALQEIGTRARVRFLFDGADYHVSGLAFGSARRRNIVLSRGLTILYGRGAQEKAAVGAIIAHELAHIYNGDLDSTYAAVWTWRFLLIIGVLPLGGWAVYEIGTGRWSVAWDNGWRVAALIAVTISIRNGLLRTREMHADSAARQLVASLMVELLVSYTNAVDARVKRRRNERAAARRRDQQPPLLREVFQQIDAQALNHPDPAWAYAKVAFQHRRLVGNALWADLWLAARTLSRRPLHSAATTIHMFVGHHHPPMRRRLEQQLEPRRSYTSAFSSAVTTGIGAVLAYDVVQTVAVVVPLPAPVLPVAGIVVAALLITTAISHDALSRALSETYIVKSVSGFVMAFAITTVMAAVGCNAGLFLGSAIALDPVSDAMGHTAAGHDQFISYWAGDMVYLVGPAITFLYGIARLWLPVAVRASTPLLPLTVMTIYSSCVMLPLLTPIIWQYFTYAHLPWERAGLPIWVPMELSKTYDRSVGAAGKPEFALMDIYEGTIDYDSNPLAGWHVSYITAALMCLAVVLGAIGASLRSTNRPWARLDGMCGQVPWHPKITILLTYVSVLTATWATLTTSQSGLQFGQWPGISPATALTTYSPAHRVIVVAPGARPPITKLCESNPKNTTCLKLLNSVDPSLSACAQHPVPPCGNPVLAFPTPGLPESIPNHDHPPQRGGFVMFDSAQADWPDTVDRYRSGVIIALPGDTVTSTGGGAPILINGAPTSYRIDLFAMPASARKPFAITVPADHVWIEAPSFLHGDSSSEHLSAPGTGAVPYDALVGYVPPFAP
ncbi:M48 family metalloprotease [Nocardia sp. CA-119907]|uniref:M48 family metalloprotease n=1 Tax=Nocardia sp. CA-119907 TaxID=3239973 RepID=UPI003D96CA9D